MRPFEETIVRLDAVTGVGRRAAVDLEREAIRFSAKDVMQVAPVMEG